MEAVLAEIEVRFRMLEEQVQQGLSPDEGWARWCWIAEDWPWIRSGRRGNLPRSFRGTASP
eukprot:15465951-Alexandrium_andersonii.AAC.1